MELSRSPLLSHSWSFLDVSLDLMSLSLSLPGQSDVVQFNAGGKGEKCSSALHPAIPSHINSVRKWHPLIQKANLFSLPSKKGHLARQPSHISLRTAVMLDNQMFFIIFTHCFGMGEDRYRISGLGTAGRMCTLRRNQHTKQWWLLCPQKICMTCCSSYQITRNCGKSFSSITQVL